MIPRLIFLLFATTGLSHPALAANEVPVSTRPNIVVFVANDMGWGDSGTYGHKLIKTPNLGKLASRGAKLTQCYSACAVCSPAEVNACRFLLIDGNRFLHYSKVQTAK